MPPKTYRVHVETLSDPEKKLVESFCELASDLISRKFDPKRGMIYLDILGSNSGNLCADFVFLVSQFVESQNSNLNIDSLLTRCWCEDTTGTDLLKL